MRKKRKLKNNTNVQIEKGSKSRHYTIDELLRLGRENNSIELAPPLFDETANKENNK